MSPEERRNIAAALERLERQVRALEAEVRELEAGPRRKPRKPRETVPAGVDVIADRIRETITGRAG